MAADASHGLPEGEGANVIGQCFPSVFTFHVIGKKPALNRAGVRYAASAEVLWPSSRLSFLVVLRCLLASV